MVFVQELHTAWVKLLFCIEGVLTTQEKARLYLSNKTIQVVFPIEYSFEQCKQQSFLVTLQTRH